MESIHTPIVRFKRIAMIILHIFFVIRVTAATGPVPDGDGYAIIRVSGQQSQTHAGVRSSDKLIKIVGKEGVATIDLEATGAGEKPPTQPTWSGSGVRGATGSLDATWTGGYLTLDSMATAAAEDGSSSLQIVRYAPLKNSIDLGTESTGAKQVVDQIDSWLTRYYKKPTWQIGGGMKFEFQRCDYYSNASKIGWNVSATGHLAVNAPGFSTEDIIPDLPTGIPGLYWKPIAEFDRFHFEGSVKGEYNEEKADPWVDPFTGKIEGGTGVKAGAKIGIGADKVAAVSLSATGQANVTGFIQFGAHGRKLCLDEYKVTIGELKGAATIKVKLIGWVEWETDLVEHTFFEGIKLPESKAPSEPVVLYTIPDPA